MNGSKEKLLQRLAKLQALANDPTGNPNETAAAAALMAEIMLRERIAEHEVVGVATLASPPEKVTSSQIVFGRSFNWQKVILSSCADCNSCILLSSPQGLRLFGAESDLAQATFLYHYLFLEISRLGSSVAFRQGAALAVHTRLFQMRKTIELEHKESRGLVLVRQGEERVREALAEEVGPTRNARLTLSTRDQREHSRGYEAGEKMELQPTKQRLVAGGRGLAAGRS